MKDLLRMVVYGGYGDHEERDFLLKNTRDGHLSRQHVHDRVVKHVLTTFLEISFLNYIVEFRTFSAMNGRFPTISSLQRDVAAALDVISRIKLTCTELVTEETSYFRFLQYNISPVCWFQST